MPPTPPRNLTLDLLLEYIARGHGFAKHAEGLGQSGELMEDVHSFRHTDTSASPKGQVLPLGRDLKINTPEDLKAYARRMLDAPDTRGFVEARNSGDVVHLFNARDKTYMVINPADVDFGSIMRYPDSAQRFTKAQADLVKDKAVLRTFDNATVPGAALRETERLVSKASRQPQLYALQRSPGEDVAQQLKYAGSQNLTRNNALSSDFQAFTHLEDQIIALRAPLDRASGYVAAVDSNGRPSQMFLLDKSTQTVTEINGSNIIQHTFEHIDPAYREAVAEQFFHAARPPGVEPLEGGYKAVVTAFQNNPPAAFPHAKAQTIPVSGAEPTQVVRNFENGQLAFRTQPGYSSLADAARQFIGFKDAQTALAFEHMPSDINAARLLDLNLDPQVAKAVQDLSLAKGYAQISEGQDVIVGLREFNETFNALEPAKQSAVLESLNRINPGRLLDLGKGANAALDALDSSSDLIRTSQEMKAGRASMSFSRSNVITALVLSGVSVAATSYANAAVLELAGQLKVAGRLTPEAYADYLEMMNSVGPMLTTQSADPLPTAIPGMVIVERIAYNRFQEFSNKHQLPENIHDMLSPSMVSGTSTRGQIGRETLSLIPLNPDQAPPELRALCEARVLIEQQQNLLDQAITEHRPTGFFQAFMDTPLMVPSGAGSMAPPPGIFTTNEVSGETRFQTNSELLAYASPEVQLAQTGLDRAYLKFQAEFDRVLSDPASARSLATLLSTDQLLEIVKATAPYHNNTLDPLISGYLSAQQLDAPFYDLMGAWNNMQARDASEQALRDHPEVMRDYLTSLFSARAIHLSPAQYELVGRSSETYDDGTTGTITVSRLTVEQHPNFIAMASAFERLKAGDRLEPVEEAELRRYLNHPQTDADQDIIDEVRKRYPLESSRYVETTEPREDLMTPALGKAGLIQPRSSAPPAAP